MTDLTIPEAAYEAGEKQALRHHWLPASDACDLAGDVICTAAPLIVAAELRRLADELDEVRAELRAEDEPSRSAALGLGVLRLRERADELDPPM